MRATSGSRIERSQSRQRSAGIGVPHVRCREMHHSGWFSIIWRMRFSPHAGVHATPGTRFSMRSRRSFALIEMNH